MAPSSPRNRNDRQRKEDGFTLVEIICTLILLGVIGAMSTVGVLQITRGFVFSRDNTDAATKAQLTLLRIIKEFTAITTVGSGTAAAITFTSQHGPSTTKTYTLSLSGTDLMLNDGATSDILLDKVTTFSLRYYDTYNGTPNANWSSTRRIIEVSITVQAADGAATTFSTRITPRNV